MDHLSKSKRVEQRVDFAKSILNESCPWLITGSTVYGDGVAYPKKDSDVDIICIFTEELLEKLKNGDLSKNTLNYCVRNQHSFCTRIKNAKVNYSLNVLFEKEFLKLTHNLNNELHVMKNLGSKISTDTVCSKFYFSGQDQKTTGVYRIERFDSDDFRIVCESCTKDGIYLGTYQDQIMTGFIVHDINSIMSNGISRLLELLNTACLNNNVKKEDLFWIKKDFWSDDFLRYMQEKLQ